MSLFKSIRRDSANYTNLIMTSNDPACRIKEMRVANWKGPLPTTEAELNQGIKNGSRAEGTAYLYHDGTILMEDFDKIPSGKIKPADVIDVQAKTIYQ